MTHEEYLARLETFTDSGEDVARVLAHAASCAVCRKQQRAVDKTLARLEPKTKSLIEEVTRWSAAAAILALVIVGFHRESRGPARAAAPRPGASYRIVGDASGVVAYTPDGIVVGLAAPVRPAEKEITK